MLLISSVYQEQVQAFVFMLSLCQTGNESLCLFSPWLACNQSSDDAYKHLHISPKVSQFSSKTLPDFIGLHLRSHGI